MLLYPWERRHSCDEVWRKLLTTESSGDQNDLLTV